jgi:hypothetical protein
MKLIRTAVAVALGAAFATSAFAQDAASITQRDVNQQQRIEQGLKSGQLTTREAASLEKGEARVDRMEANAMKDGTLTPAEKARITRAQNAESRAIARDKTNAQTGDPNSASSKRMQADVQRNVNQEQRINQGVRSGALTTSEAGKLERGQARVDRKEARAGADGHVGKGEQARIQTAEDRQSRNVYREKHDAQTK